MPSNIHNEQEIRKYDSSPSIGDQPVNAAENSGNGGGGGGGGTIWYSGFGVPSAGLGVVGDFYFEKSNIQIYGPKTIGGWGTPLNLRGQQGSTGIGIPTGGAQGQVLKKVNSVDYNTQWAEDLNTGTGGGGATNLSYDAAGRQVVSDTGTDATLPLAVDAGNAGLMSGADKTKLNGIEPGATADLTNTEIEALYNTTVPLATTPEAQAGTSTNVRRWTPQRIAEAIAALSAGAGGSLTQAAADALYLKLDSLPVTLGTALSDETTALTTGQKASFRAPFGFTVTGVRATLTTADTAALTTVDININGTSILSTKLTIDANEKSSTTAATAPVFSATAITDDVELTFDIDAVGTVARGLKVWLLGYRTVSNQALATVPVQVGTVTPTAGSGQVTLAWTAPTNGGAAITDYIVQQSLDGSTWTTAGGSVVSTATNQTVTGLANGTLYFFRVAAVNAIGQGAYSAASSSTPVGAPAAANGPSFSTISSTSVVVNWVAPSNGGSPITQVELQRSLVANFSSGVTTIFTDSTSPFDTTFTDTGLTNGTTYYYRVRYTNALGTTAGGGNPATTGATAPAVAAAPTFASVLQTSMTVNWVAPSNGGSILTRVVLERATDSGFTTALTTLVDQTATPPTTLTFNDTGRTAATTYYYRVRYSNANGSTNGAGGSQATLANAVPAAPTISVVPGDTQNVITVTNGSNGGLAVTGHSLERSLNGTTGWTAINAASLITANGNAGSTGTFTHTGLTNGTAHYYRCSASNAIGDGTYSAVSGPHTPVSAGGSAPTFVGSSSVEDITTPANTSPLTITRTNIGAIAAGDYLVGIVESGFDPKFGTGYGGPGAGWSLVSTMGGAVNGFYTRIYVKVATGSEPSTYSVSGGSVSYDTMGRFTILAYRGATAQQSALGTLDQDNSNICTAPTITPSFTNGRLVTIFLSLTGEIFTTGAAPTGHTERIINNSGGTEGLVLYVSERTAALTTAATGATTKATTGNAGATFRQGFSLVLTP